ncbi:hypothetical protein K502DRAFT_367993 [Neoconidiobolus thromboides FSU 785]|nr:hypothetical protein K502DRAFT_367993 [Neoconidiobolus thromboides FSU 785]
MENSNLFQTNRELAYKIEQETNQLETLKSHLKLNNEKSIKAYQMLGNFDDRLTKLETSILPIHELTQKLKRFNENVEVTVHSLTSTIQQMDIAQQQEPILLAGPKQDLKSYLKAVDSMREARSYLEKSKLKHSIKAQGQVNQVLKAVLQHLLQSFKNILQDQSQMVEGESFEQILDIKEDSLSQLLEIIEYTNKVEIDLNLKQSGNLLRVLSESRNKLLLDCMQSHIRKCNPSSKEQVSQGSTYQKGTCPYIPYTRDLINLLQQEEMNLKRLLKSGEFSNEYGESINTSLSKYVETGEQLFAYAKKDLHNEIFLLYDILENLLFYQNDILGIYSKAGLNENNFQDLIQNITKTLMKSLPAFLEDIRGGIKNQTTLSQDGTVHEMASSALNFIKRILEYPNTVESNLKTLGRAHSCVKTEDNYEYETLSMKYFTNVMDSLLQYVEAKSKGYKNSTLRAIFLMNNIFYLQKSLNVNNLNKYIHENKLQFMEKTLKRSMDQYHESWKSCLECLTDTNLTRINLNSNSSLSSSERSNIKDKFKNFNQNIEEIVKQHKAYTISDPELKQKLIDQILKILLPIYSRNQERFISTDFSKNPSKYILYNKDSLSQLVHNLF